MRNGNGWFDSSGLFPQQQRTVFEKQREEKPVLYDSKGNPLHYPKQPMGFDPKRIRK